jgi:hypothetical protein
MNVVSFPLASLPLLVGIATQRLNERPRKAMEFETRRSDVTAVLRRPVAAK